MSGRCITQVEIPDDLADAAVLILCEDCQAAREKDFARQRRSHVGVPRSLERYTLADVDQPDGIQQGITLVTAWVCGDCALAGLEGPVGVGKTRLAIAAANMLAARGESVRYYSTASLARTLSLDFTDYRRTAAVDALMGRCALVLDDIESVGSSQYAAEQLYVAINERVDGAAPLLVTTNLSMPELATYWTAPLVGERIASRLCLLRWEYLDGTDKRRAALEARCA